MGEGTQLHHPAHKHWVRVGTSDDQSWKGVFGNRYEVSSLDKESLVHHSTFEPWG